jgi:hypothetical protein
MTKPMTPVTPNLTLLAMERSYELASLAPAPSPVGSTDTDWYRYVIRHGENEIVGHRRGDDDTVRRGVQALVAQLNERLHVKVNRAAGSKR